MNMVPAGALSTERAKQHEKTKKQAREWLEGLDRLYDANALGDARFRAAVMGRVDPLTGMQVRKEHPLFELEPATRNDEGDELEDEPEYTDEDRAKHRGF